MSVISKELFQRKVGQHEHCSELHFWEKDCLRASFLSPYLIYNSAKGTAKFFLPIYLLKLLLNYKKMKDIDFIKSLFIEEATSTLYGVMLICLLISSICILRKIFGQIHYYNVVFFPGIISGLSLLVETRENQILDTLIFFNSFVETVLNIANFSFFKITRVREILLFMGVSATLMYLLENRSKELNLLYFWFYTPSRRKNGGDEDKNKVCSHPNCWTFWKEGFVKYFSLGYLVNVIRETIPKVGILAKKPQKAINILLNTSNFKFGLFIGGYVATHRILTCCLLKWGKVGEKFHSLIAGLLSGLTYAISPNIQVLVVGITTILQILYANLCQKLNFRSNFWPRQIVYMLSHGILLHIKIFYPKFCSSYYRNMADACTNNVIAQVYEKILSKYFFEEVGRKHIFKHITGL